MLLIPLMMSLLPIQSFMLAMYKKTKTVDSGGDSGGYYHIYPYNTPKQVNEEMNSCINKRYKKMEKTLNDFEEGAGWLLSILQPFSYP